MLSISSGHSSKYLTDAVAQGRENYYTGAVAAGEPPGRWYGRGAATLGLHGLVDTRDMTAVFEHFLDPRDPRFMTPEEWSEADTLGHGGRRYRTPDEIYGALLAAEPDTTPERREQLRIEAGQKARQNVAFHDATFSVQKSVTVPHAAFEAQETSARNAGDHAAADAWAAHRTAVEDAIWAGNNAALDYLQDRAGYSRVGHHAGKAGRFVDAHDFVVASFFQHDNRNHDPQLHIHNAILNRVQGDDGEWRTLDGASLYLHRTAAAAVGERTTEEHLARSLGVRFAMRPDGKAREILGIRQPILDLFSTRRRAVTAKTAELVEAFETKYGRSPNALQLDRLQRQATLATRKAKSHDGETVEERLDRWDQELRAEIAGGLGEVADTVLALRDGDRQAKASEVWSPTDVIDAALAEVQAQRQSWTRADLARAINAALPDHLGGLSAERVTQLIEALTEEAIDRGAVQLTAPGPATDSLPEQLTLADGGSAYDRPGSTTYATAGHLRAEKALRTAALDTGAPTVADEQAQAFVDALREQGIVLGADQAAAVRGVLTSGAHLETLVGPAGTGKSFVLGALARAWTSTEMWGGRQHRVVGLASAQIATDNLAGEGLTARNIAQWLAVQKRLAGGARAPDDVDWKLQSGDLVVVDESAMASTADLTAIKAHVDAAGAKLLLTGDHRQLTAVGAGGGMRLVADAGARHELSEVRRFTHAWERAASLRLREGDPDALREYRKHGRLVDAGTLERAEHEALRSYLADTLAGKQSLLIVDTNDQAAGVSARVRAELVRLGRVTDTGVPLGLDGTVAGVGDLVQARRNAWQLAGVEGNRRGPINRERYRVLETRDDGSLVVTPIDNETAASDRDRVDRADEEHRGRVGERITLPPSYVDKHLALGYASTVYSAQGLTVDTCHGVATGHTGAAALYVELSRGRESNTCYVVTHNLPADSPAGQGNKVARRDPLNVLTDAFELTAGPTGDGDLAAIAETEHRHTDAETVQTAGERFADVAELATTARAAASLDRLVDAGLLTPAQRAAAAGEDGMAALAHLLRRAEVAGHHPHRVLEDAVRRAPLTGAHSITNVLHARITKTMSPETPGMSLEPVGDTYADRVPALDDPAWQRHLSDLAAAADDRTRQLGAETAETQPLWAIEAFGPVPDEPDQRAEWEQRAGIVAAHRELAAHDDDATVLPGPPKPEQVEAYASWRAAWRALGRPEARRAEAEMSDGQLRARIRAYEREETWAPAYVAPELAGTSQAEAKQRRIAELRAAEAHTATGPDQRARLAAEAAEAAALADQLATQRDQLERADHARALWYAHTAETRAAADRAKSELSARGAELAQLDDHTTTDDWLTEHTGAAHADDAYRDITGEHDLTDVVAARDADVAATFPDTEAAGPAPADIRATTEPIAATAEQEGDWTRVPTGDETAATIARAQDALAELERRQRHDRRRAFDDANHQHMWHSHGQPIDEPANTRSLD